MPYIISDIYNMADYEDVATERIVEIIASKHYLDSVLAIQNAVDKKQRDALKKQLPAFSLARFNPGKLIRDNLAGSEYLIYDVDNLTKAEMQEARVKLKGAVMFMFTSPSGKGLKFVIRLSREILPSEYTHNRRHYLEYFSEILESIGVKLDRSYHALQTFISADGSCKIYENHPVYPAYTTQIARVGENVEDRNIALAEVQDVCEFLANHKLSYHEWLSVALALKSLLDLPNVKPDEVKAIFVKMGEKDTDPDHRHRNWGNKFDNVGIPKDIQIGTLFWIAADRGYRRKVEFVQERGEKRPFYVGKDGLYSKGKEPELVFGFQDIKIKHVIIDEKSKDNSYTVIDVDGTEIMMPTKAMNSPQLFSSIILSSMYRTTYMALSTGRKYYDALFKWMARTAESLVVRRLRGAGLVNTQNPRMWNFGSMVIVDGKVYPHESIIQTGENTGYMIDEIPSLNIETSREFPRKLEMLFDFYDNWAAIAIGWAAANIVFKEVLSDFGGFPILFIHGDTASGKSQLAHVILSMFGIQSPESSEYKVNMDKATDKAMNRVKDNAAGIPHMFDEYGGSINAARHQQQFLVLKSMYDGSSTTYAKFSNDNETWKLLIRSGSIFTSCIPVTEAEGVERCVYIDMTGVSTNKDSSLFSRELQGAERRLLSPFAAGCACEMDYPTWRKYYHEAYVKLREFGEIRNRPLINYSIVLASYNYAKDILGRVTKLPDIGVSWWVERMGGSSEMARTSNPARRFLDYAHLLASNAYVNNREVSWASMEGDLLHIKVKPALLEISHHFRADEKLPPAKELSKALKELPDFIEAKTRYIGGGSAYALTFRIKDEPQAIKQIELPF